MGPNFRDLRVSCHKRSSDKSDDHLWRETSSHGNSVPSVCWHCTQTPRVERSDGILVGALPDLLNESLMKLCRFTEVHSGENDDCNFFFLSFCPSSVLSHDRH